MKWEISSPYNRGEKSWLFTSSTARSTWSLQHMRPFSYFQEKVKKMKKYDLKLLPGLTTKAPNKNPWGFGWALHWIFFPLLKPSQWVCKMDIFSWSFVHKVTVQLCNIISVISTLQTPTGGYSAFEGLAHKYPHYRTPTGGCSVFWGLRN